MVRRTQSSRSQPSSLNSGTLAPLRYRLSGLCSCYVAVQNAVAQQAQAAEIRKSRSLGEPGHDRQVQRRRQAGYRQVDVDHALQPTAGNRLPVPGRRLVTQQSLEPPSVEADGHDNGVISDALALIAVG